MHESVTALKSFKWKKVSEGVETELQDNGDTVRISSSGLSSPMSTSVLSAMVNSMGSLQYVCTAEILQLYGEGDVISRSDSANITVKGKSFLPREVVLNFSYTRSLFRGILASFVWHVATNRK